jgi:hypothetical protein
MPADQPERRRSRGPSSYAVGYGKPPLETRFTPGRSGNPKGRPSARKNLRTEVREALTAPITVTMDGRKVKMSKRQAMLEKQTAKAPEGFRSMATRPALSSCLNWRWLLRIAT